MTLISVIVPIYKCEEYIDKCITSVLEQSFNDFEIICVYDGEKIEGSKCHKYAVDSRVKLFEKEHGGLSDTRNYGYTKASGKYIYYLDSDDYLSPNALTTIVEQMEYNTLDILCFDAGLFDHDSGDFINENRYHRELKIQGVVRGELLLEVMINNNSFRSPVWLMCFKKEFYDNNHLQFKKGILHEDELFTYTAMMQAKRTCWVPLELNLHRIRRDSIMSSTKTHNNVDGYIEVLLGIINHNEIQHIENNCSKHYEYRMRKLLMKTYNQLDPSEQSKVRKLTSDELEILKNNGCEDVVNFFTEKSYVNSVKFNNYLDNKRDPIVSIVMPVYNAEQFITDTLGDIFNQTLDRFELICVDDGSTDSSLEILKEYSKSHSNMMVLTQPNKSAGAARNLGFKSVKTEYVIFLDSDDRFDPHLLQYSMNRIIDTESDVAIFKADILDSKTNTLKPADWYLREVNPKIFNPDNCDKLMQITTGNPWNKLFSVKFLLNTGLKFQESKRANDLFMIYSNLTLANKICIIDNVLLHYRINAGNSLQDTSQQTPLDFYKALLALQNQLIKSGKYELHKQSFVNMCLRNIINNLNKVHTYSSVKIIYNCVKKEMLDKLDISGQKNSFFYDKNDLKQLRYYENTSLYRYLYDRANVNKYGYIGAVTQYLRRG